MSELLLIADGDAERGKALAEACAARGLACHVTSHGAAALEAALADPPSVLVAQLELPLIEGPRLADILRANPRTRHVGVIFVGDRPADASRADVGGRVMAPPLDLDEVAGCAAALVSQRPSPAAASPAALALEPGGVEGQLAQLALADLLQLFHVGRKTGCVELRQADGAGVDRGRVYLRDGELVHARCGRVEGEKALYRLLAWDRGSFAFEPGGAHSAHTLDKPTRALLREGQRQLDEWARLAVELPPRDAHVALKIQRSALPNVIHPLTQEVLLILDLYSRVDDVLDHCSFPDYQVLRTLQTLVARGMVELRREPEAARARAGVFSRAAATRLREWLAAAGPGAARGAKLLVLSSSGDALRAFARLMAGQPGAEIDERFASGELAEADLAPLGHLAADSEHGIDFLHVPADPGYAPLWPAVAHGALGSLLLLSGPVEAAVSALRPAAQVLGRSPRARVFHVMLLAGGERVDAGALRGNLTLLDPGSLFLLPVENPESSAGLLREMLARFLP